VEKNSRSAARPALPAPLMSLSELAQLGEAKALFPAVENLPEGIDLFSLHGADGTPLILTDSRQAAVGHAIGDELEIASVH
jgi:hypothetical protein